MPVRSGPKAALLPKMKRTSLSALSFGGQGLRGS